MSQQQQPYIYTIVDQNNEIKEIHSETIPTNVKHFRQLEKSSTTGQIGYHVVSPLSHMEEIQTSVINHQVRPIQQTDFGLTETTLKDNFNVQRPPNSTDNFSQGYSIGSRWIDSLLGNLYVCIYSDNGTATWDKVDIDEEIKLEILIEEAQKTLALYNTDQTIGTNKMNEISFQMNETKYARMISKDTGQIEIFVDDLDIPSLVLNDNNQIIVGFDEKKDVEDPYPPADIIVRKGHYENTGYLSITNQSEMTLDETKKIILNHDEKFVGSISNSGNSLAVDLEDGKKMFLSSQELVVNTGFNQSFSYDTVNKWLVVPPHLTSLTILAIGGGGGGGSGQYGQMVEVEIWDEDLQEYIYENQWEPGLNYGGKGASGEIQIFTVDLNDISLKLIQVEIGNGGNSDTVGEDTKVYGYTDSQTKQLILTAAGGPPGQSGELGGASGIQLHPYNSYEPYYVGSYSFGEGGNGGTPEESEGLGVGPGGTGNSGYCLISWGQNLS